MPTVAKPTVVLMTEKKSHRTKKEIAIRKEAEEGTLTGSKMIMSEQVSNDKIAKAEWERLCSLLDKIEKNDGIYENVINRYCLLQSEIVAYELKKEELETLSKTLNEKMANYPADLMMDMVDKVINITKAINACDKQINAKRTMMFNIEKENIMTIASALRTVPKTQSKKKSALQEALGG